MHNFKKITILLGCGLAMATPAMAQLTGTKTIGPGMDYATLALAIADLNTQGVGAGGVTFNVAAGYTEAFAARQDGLITATGTAANPIVIQKSGAGANPVITGATAGQTGVRDYILGLSGTDYITIDGLSLSETTGAVEYGIAGFKPSGTDGCQFVTIRNCTTTLSLTNTTGNGFGFQNNTEAGGAITVSAATGSHSNLKIYGNSINNSRGILLSGFQDNTPPYILADHDNEIGVTAGNTITNLSGGTALFHGLRCDNQRNLKIHNNTFTGVLQPTGVPNMIFLAIAPNADAEVLNNTITGISMPNMAATSFIGINIATSSDGNAGTVTVRGNTITGCTYPGATTGSFTAIASTVSSNAPYNFIIAGNTITGNTLGSNTATATGNFQGIAITVPNTNAGSLTRIDSNIIVGNQHLQSVPGLGNDNYIAVTASGRALQVSYNRIDSNSTTATPPTYGILANYGAATTEAKTITHNTIANITAPGNITGIAQISTPTTGLANTIIAFNRVHNLKSTTTGAVTLYGISTDAGLSSTLTNNVVSELYATNATGNQIIMGGIAAGNVLPESALQVYHNTVYLNGTTAGGNFNSSALLAAGSGAGSVDVRNNNLVNAATPQGTGTAVAYAAQPANVAAASDGNNLYTTAGAGRHLFMNTATATPATTLAAFKTLMGTSHQNDTTALPLFIDISAAPYNLHIATNIYSPLESGGVAISPSVLVNTDHDGNPRYPNAGYPDNALFPATAADIGAYEFAGWAPGAALPVTLLRFSGSRLAEGNQLAWATTTETNAAYFEVQYSADARSYHTIAQLKAAGTTLLQQDYAYLHRGVSGTAYYRLKMADADGSFTYSNGIKLAANAAESVLDMHYYPVPFTQALNLRFSGTQAQSVLLVMYNLTGSEVLRTTILAPNGAGHYTLPTDKLPAGTYLLRATAENGATITRKVVKQ